MQQDIMHLVADNPVMRMHPPAACVDEYERVEEERRLLNLWSFTNVLTQPNFQKKK